MCDLNIQCKCKSGKCGAQMSKEKRELPKLKKLPSILNWIDCNTNSTKIKVAGIDLKACFEAIEARLAEIEEILCQKL